MNLRMHAAALLLCFMALYGALARPAAAQGDRAAELKQQHREAALRYFGTLKQGIRLSGSVVENGSPGTFEANFIGDVWTVRQRFGDLMSMSYEGPEGSWARTNYSLPYRFEAEDNPASTVLSLLTGGSYLNEPYWSAFNFVDDAAGGYNFEFTPEGLPPVKVVLYSDNRAPDFMQIMSLELDLSPTDPDSHTYRSYYYYSAGENGELFTARETGREIDSIGATASFSEYTVEQIDRISELPAESRFDFERKPIDNVGAELTAPVEIPVNVGAGYFIVPLTFAGSDRTWNFILDTGASASLFTPEAAAAAGLTTSIKVPAHGHGSRVDFEMGLVTTASVGAADADPAQRAPLAGFPVARVSESNKDVLSAFANYDVGGILGVTLLHQYIVRFDHMNQTITLIPPHLFDGSAVARPNVEIWLDVEDLIYLTGYISDGTNRVRGELVLDTGLQQQLAVLRETIDRNGLQFTKKDSRTNTVLGGARSFDYVSVPLFEVAVMSWPDVEASVTSDDKGTLSARGLLGFLGAPFFFGTRVTIDLFGERMYMRPLEPGEMEQLMNELRDAMGLPRPDEGAEEPADPDAADAEAEDAAGTEDAPVHPREDERFIRYRERLRERLGLEDEEGSEDEDSEDDDDDGGDEDNGDEDNGDEDAG